MASLSLHRPTEGASSNQLQSIAPSSAAHGQVQLRSKNIGAVEVQIAEQSSTEKSQYEATTKSAPEPGWFHWYEPGTSFEEKKLIFKLD